MRTQECYFQIGVHPQDEYCAVSFLITPKAYFDVEHALDDSGDEPTDLPAGFSQMAESEYEYNGIPSEGKKKLIDAGAMEYRMFPDNEGAITPLDIVEADRAFTEHQGRSEGFGYNPEAEVGEEEEMEGEEVFTEMREEELDAEKDEKEQEEDMNNRPDVIAYSARLKEKRIADLKEDLQVAIGAESYDEAAIIRDKIEKEETT